MASIPDREYWNLKSAIEAANDAGDKDALRKLKLQIIANYGQDDRDPRYLLSLFKYTV